MNRREFVLQPFPGLPAPDGVRGRGVAELVGSILHLDWRLEAPAGTVAIPPLDAHPQRRRELWEETCFECFLGPVGQAGYREFNLSPAGHWNVFRFDAYRSGMADETLFSDLPFTRSDRDGICEVSARLDVTDLGLAVAPWRLAVATVVAWPGGQTSFWALSHPGAQPDFHHLDAFKIALGTS